MTSSLCEHDQRSSKIGMQYNVVIGGGGARVMPAAAGAICAFERAGLKINTMGGVSGGFLVALLSKSGMPGRKIARLAVETVFQKLLSLRSIIGLFKAQVLRRINERLLPLEAVFGSTALGDWYEQKVSHLPEGCWTIGVHGNHGSEYNLRPYLFTGKGVFEQRDDYTYQQIAALAPPVGTCVRLTVAVPGIIEPIQFNCPSRALCLFDGMLTPEGRCPINPIIHHYKQERESIIAFDVGPEEPSFLLWLQNTVYEYWCKRCYMESNAVDKIANKDVIVIHPKVKAIASMQFRVQQLPKLHAVLEGYLATLRTLVHCQLCQASLLDEANAIVEAVGKLQDQIAKDTTLWSWQRKKRTVQLIKVLLTKHGLYELDP